MNKNHFEFVNHDPVFNRKETFATGRSDIGRADQQDTIAWVIIYLHA